MMTRRLFVAGAIEIAPLGGPLKRAWAYGKKPTIGFLSSFSPEPNSRELVSFHQGLGEQHYFEGESVDIEYRWAEGHLDRLSALAADLVSSRVDVIAALAYSAAAAAKSQTKSIPIVFYSALDPVEGRLVDSLAHPGGNLTGVVGLSAHLIPKLISLLRDLIPPEAPIGLLVNPNGVIAKSQMDEAEAAGVATGVKLIVMRASTESDLKEVFPAFNRNQIGGLVITADAFFRDHPDLIVQLAAQESIPAIYNDRAYAFAGGLMSYGANLPDIYAQVGRYVGKILKGAKAADLPAIQPTRFELVINLRTAKALSLVVPQILLAQADEVIE